MVGQPTSMRRFACAAVLTASMLLVSGCAGWRYRLPRGVPGADVIGPRVEPTKDARAMGAFLRGQLALERDDPEAALPAFETAVEADPGLRATRSLSVATARSVSPRFA